MNAFGVEDVEKGYVGDKVVQVKTALERRKAKPRKVNMALRPLSGMNALMGVKVAKGATSAAWKTAIKATGSKIGSVASDAADVAAEAPSKAAELATKHPKAAAGAFFGTEAALVGGAGYGGYRGVKALRKKQAKKTTLAKLYTEHRPSTAKEIAESGFKDKPPAKKYSGKRIGAAAGVGGLTGLVIRGPLGAAGGAAIGAGAQAGIDAATWKKRKAASDRRLSNPISTMRTDEWHKGDKPYVDRFPKDGSGYLSKPVKRFSRSVGGE